MVTSCSSASTSSRKPSGRATRIGPLVWPRRMRSPPGTTVVSRSSAARRSSSSARDDTWAKHGGRSAPTGKPVRYHDVCLRNARSASSLVAVVGDQCRACSTITSADDAERPRAGDRSARRARRRDRRTATAGRGSHGPRPRRRIRSARIIATASVGLPDVAVAEHGDRRDVRLELADGIPPSLAGVVLLHGAGVQRDGRDALVLADLAGSQVGEQPSWRPRRNFAVTGTPYGAAAPHRRPHDRPEQVRAGGHRRAAALAGDLGRRAPEVEVEVVDDALRRRRGGRPGPSSRGSEPYSWRLRGCSSGPNVTMRSVLALPWTSAVANTISLT